MVVTADEAAWDHHIAGQSLTMMIFVLPLVCRVCVLGRVRPADAKGACRGLACHGGSHSYSSMLFVAPGLGPVLDAGV